MNKYENVMVNVMIKMHFWLPITPPHLSFCSSSSKNKEKEKVNHQELMPKAFKAGLALPYRWGNALAFYDWASIAI